MDRNEYRDAVRTGTREGHWTFWKVLPLFMLVVAALGGIGMGGKWLGLWGGTFVERKVFEQSYQRSEGFKARIATDRAALAGIEEQLRDPQLEDSTRRALKAQAAAIRVRLSAADQQQ